MMKRELRERVFSILGKRERRRASGAGEEGPIVYLQADLLDLLRKRDAQGGREIGGNQTHDIEGKKVGLKWGFWNQRKDQKDKEE